MRYPKGYRKQWFGRTVPRCAKHQEQSVTVRDHDGFDRVTCKHCGSEELRVGTLFSNINALRDIPQSS